MLKLVVLAVVVAVVASEDCGPLERLKVKGQWAAAYGEGNDRNSFSQALWRTFFNLDPTARRFFNRVHGDDTNNPAFRAHSQRVLSGLDLVVSVLDDEDVLQAELVHLKAQHDERQIAGYYFDTFGKALSEVVPAVLGRCYDADAWSSCYHLITAGIKP